MLQSFAISFGTILAFHVLHALVRRLPTLFPSTPAPGQTRWTLERLEQVYGPLEETTSWTARWSWSWVIPAALWYLPLLGIAGLMTPDPGEYELLVDFPGYIWVLNAALAGMVTHFLARRSMLKWRLKHSYDEYRLYMKWKHGRLEPLFDYGLAGIAILGFIMFAPHGFATYTLFGEDRVVVKRAFEETRSYPYYEILEIRLDKEPRGKRGETVMRHRYEIEFADGYVWDMGEAGRSDSLCKAYPIFAFVADRSGKSINGHDRVIETGHCR